MITSLKGFGSAGGSAIDRAVSFDSRVRGRLKVTGALMEDILEDVRLFVLESFPRFVLECPLGTPLAEFVTRKAVRFAYDVTKSKRNNWHSVGFTDEDGKKKRKGVREEHQSDQTETDSGEYFDMLIAKSNSSQPKVCQVGYGFLSSIDPRLVPFAELLYVRKNYLFDCLVEILIPGMVVGPERSEKRRELRRAYIGWINTGEIPWDRKKGVVSLPPKIPKEPLWSPPPGAEILKIVNSYNGKPPYYVFMRHPSFLIGDANPEDEMQMVEVKSLINGREFRSGIYRPQMVKVAPMDTLLVPKHLIIS